MKYYRSERFDRSFKKLSFRIKKVFYKQLNFLLKDLKHPSLRAKKYDEATGVWQARVTQNVRFYFVIDKDSYFLVDIKKHKD